MVLRQCASLVRKDVLNLAKVFADVERPALERCVRRSIVHVTVPVDEVDLDELDYLNGNVERDWDNHLRLEMQRNIYLKSKKKLI